MKKKLLDIVIAALVAAVPVFLQALLNGLAGADITTSTTATGSALGIGTLAVRSMTR